MIRFKESVHSMLSRQHWSMSQRVKDGSFWEFYCVPDNMWRREFQ